MPRHCHVTATSLPSHCHVTDTSLTRHGHGEGPCSGPSPSRPLPPPAVAHRPLRRGLARPGSERARPAIHCRASTANQKPLFHLQERARPAIHCRASTANQKPLFHLQERACPAIHCRASTAMKREYELQLSSKNIMRPHSTLIQPSFISTSYSFPLRSSCANRFHEPNPNN